MWLGLAEPCPKEAVFPAITHHGPRNVLGQGCTVSKVHLFSHRFRPNLWLYGALPYKSEVWFGAVDVDDPVRVLVMLVLTSGTSGSF